MSDLEDDISTKSTSVSLPIARGVRCDETAAPATRRPPPPGHVRAGDEREGGGPAPRYVSDARVRNLFERFARTVEPGSIGFVEAQRELRTAYRKRVTETELWALMERLALRLPTQSARERFLLDVADLRV